MTLEAVSLEGGVPTGWVPAILFSCVLMASVTLIGLHTAYGGCPLAASQHLGLELHSAVFFSELDELACSGYFICPDAGVV